jgi:hypothetical protein
MDSSLCFCIPVDHVHTEEEEEEGDLSAVWASKGEVACSHWTE